LWVNTTGMRRPTVSRHDLAKTLARLSHWTALRRGGNGDKAVPGALTVITPPMWPGFDRRLERRVNAVALGRAVRRALGAPVADPPVVVTTLPIASVLLDRLDGARWVYYCVDDFSVWPGLRANTMHALEARLLECADRIVAASSVLQDRLAARGRPDATLLTHGVDLPHWRTPAHSASFAWVGKLPRPITLFWGLLDQRLDPTWLHALRDRGPGGSLILAGPMQARLPMLESLDAHLAGPVAYETLPALAALADVLVMPYTDSAVTRAMQPLKLKEYLATDKPVVLRALPSTAEWADAADVVDSADAFADAVARRAREGVPAHQLRARQRLCGESWDDKARALESILARCGTQP
jgi:glycosyltransferase involved in cell wall biosynthesis